MKILPSFRRLACECCVLVLLRQTDGRTHDCLLIQ